MIVHGGSVPRTTRRRGFVAVWPALVAVVVAIVASWAPATAAFAVDDYPVALQNPLPDTVTDSWGFWNRECTSFVAWRMTQARVQRGGVPFTNAWGKGARLQALAEGHVAYVSAVAPDGSVTIEDYNGSGGTGTYGTLSGERAPRYIHIADVPPPPPPARPVKTSGLVLDGWGGLQGYSEGGAPVPVGVGGPYWPGLDVARGVDTTIANGGV